jgi:hypothetical protein
MLKVIVLQGQAVLKSIAKKQSSVVRRVGVCSLQSTVARL